ncbi:MAG: hypothetical protein SFW62_04980, partial [Alphaproteobacteria bacterium]|nr:hypothetical protein [Alphaproteobacteria bacterium]
MRKVLVACSENGHDTVTELPAVLKRAGLDVTLMSSRKIRSYIGSYSNRWIESSENAASIIQQIAELLARDSFDWIILGDDFLLRALADSPLEDALKSRIGPLRHSEYLRLLGSKAESTRFAADIDVLTPPFQICSSFAEIERAAAEIGFPCMIKIDRSGGGDGVFKCNSAIDLEYQRNQLQSGKFLVEKYIEGAAASVEPLFLDGRLVAYSYGDMLMTYGKTGVSSRRYFQPCPALADTLEKISMRLGLHGFCNFTFMRDATSGQHYLIEMDMRPNAWVAYTRFAGIDFSRAIQQYLANPDFRAQNFCAAAQRK